MATEQKKKTPIGKYVLYFVGGIVGIGVLGAIFGKSDKPAAPKTEVVATKDDSMRVASKLSEIKSKIEGVRENKYAPKSNKPQDVFLSAYAYRSAATVVERAAEFDNAELRAAAEELKKLLLELQPERLKELRVMLVKGMNESLNASGVFVELDGNAMLIDGRGAEGLAQEMMGNAKRELADLRIREIWVMNGKKPVSKNPITMLTDKELWTEGAY